MSYGEHMKCIAVLVMSLAVFGCMKDTTLVVGKLNPEYVGSWYFLDEIDEVDYYLLNAVTLEILESGEVNYVKCEILKDSRSSFQKYRRVSVEFPNARIIEIAKGEISIEQSLSFIHIENSLDVPSPPVIEDGSEYLYVEGYKLTKTNENIDFSCPDDEG
jgi:hypothetical protein